MKWTTTRDQNGNPVYRSMQRERGGWGVNVWTGYPWAIDIRRYVYRTRRQALNADIADHSGFNGRIA